MPMIKLTKEVARETSATVFERSKHRPVIVSLHPPHILGFRLKGTKHTYFLPVDQCFWIAMQAEQNGKRKAGRR